MSNKPSRSAPHVPNNVRRALDPPTQPLRVPPAQPPAGPSPLPTAQQVQDAQQNMMATFKQAHIGLVTPLAELQDKLGHPVIAYVLKDGAQVADDVYATFMDIMKAIGAVDKISVLLHTNGGQTETPYKLMTLLRNYAKVVDVLIPMKALSAGTHFALGADQIVMTRSAQMGPVDPSRMHHLLPKGADGKSIAISVQDLKHCVEFIKREAGGELTSDAFAQIITALFREVHPLAIGAIEESYALGRLVTKKMLEMHMDAEVDKPKIDFIVDQLSDGYKSHAFAYGQREAEKIGLKAVMATPEIEALMISALLTILGMQIQSTLDQPPGAQMVNMGAVVTVSCGAGFQMQVMTPVEGSKPPALEPVGAQWFYVA